MVIEKLNPSCYCAENRVKPFYLNLQVLTLLRQFIQEPVASKGESYFSTRSRISR